MYKTSLYFHLIATENNQNIVRMFFEDWSDRICNNQANYTVIDHNCNGIHSWEEILRVDFMNEEDATAIKLKGIPPEFQNHLKFIN